MANTRKTSTFGRGGRHRSGKLLRQALYQDVYAWKPFPPDFQAKPIFKTKTARPVIPTECCEICEGKTVDNCVTYVLGGSCDPPVVAAYVECEYVR